MTWLHEFFFVLQLLSETCCCLSIGLQQEQQEEEEEEEEKEDERVQRVRDGDLPLYPLCLGDVVHLLSRSNESVRERGSSEYSREGRPAYSQSMGRQG